MCSVIEEMKIKIASVVFYKYSSSCRDHSIRTLASFLLLARIAECWECYVDGSAHIHNTMHLPSARFSSLKL